jgi:hypothetical protein
MNIMFDCLLGENDTRYADTVPGLISSLKSNAAYMVRKITKVHFIPLFTLEKWERVLVSRFEIF